MLKLLGPVPPKVIIACSGGVDSMVVTNFLLQSKRHIELAYFNHGTSHGDKAQTFVQEFAESRLLKLHIGHIQRSKYKKESSEEYWRKERYQFLDQFEFPVVTAHHLDDCVETWIFSSLNGQSKLIPYKRNNVIRPFLLTSKKDLLDWGTKRYLSWIDDESNHDLNYARNRIRHQIVPEALKINPGLHKVVARKIQTQYYNYGYPNFEQYRESK